MAARGRWPGAAWLFLILPLGCASQHSTGPETSVVSGAPPVAVARIEVITNPAVNPDPAYSATCQTGAIVRLIASESRDPLGQGLTYRWRDRIEGELAPDFGPGRNPLETTESDTGVLFSSIAVHDLELTVTAADGRKASTSLSVLVTSCVVCGGP